ncbi:MAG: 1-acyl-sn-glycerol-3-phosphate acyltransferase [Cyclobacteriaceae bacterium]
MAHPFYLFVKYTSWLGLRLFFGGINLIDTKNLPKDGAVIFAPNHQGAFMDALILGVSTGRPVHFLTRADIFKKPWVISILKSLHMMPIYRIRDGRESLSQNDSVFDTCFELLSKGKGVLIFPEGNHSIDYYLRPISKGTARLALDARAALDPNMKLYIVPTGINYFSHRWPFAKVKIKFGEPLDADNYRQLYEEHQAKAYNAFKQDLTEGMKSTMILAEHDENYEAKRDFIFQPKHENLSFEKLKAMGDSDEFEVRKEKKLGFFAKMIVGFLSVFNLPPMLLLSKFLRIFKDPVFHISIKYLAGSLFHILWWSLLFALGVIFIGWEAGLLFAITAIVVAFAKQSIKSY